MESGDWAAAEAAFERLLVKNPADPQAKVGLATAGLYSRIGDVDQVAAVAAADADPRNAKQILAADIAAAGGDVEGAFARLIETVRITGMTTESRHGRIW